MFLKYIVTFLFFYLQPTKLTGESENAKSFNFLTSISPLEDWAFYDQIAMAFILSGDYLKPVRIGITEVFLVLAKIKHKAII